MALALANVALAQAHPDFSGRWLVEPAPTASGPAVSGTMGSGWGSELTVTQTASRLTVEYVFFSRGDMQAPLKFVYALDGAETRNSVMMGRGFQEHVSTAAWDGARLVITTRQTFPNPTGSGAPITTEMKQALSLDSPTLLTIETTRAGVMGGAASTTRTVYKKL
jgi:hypothetical protein